MDYTTLDVSLENDVACVILNRPEVMNALNTQMRAEICDAVKNLGKEARVVVITGVGQAFCSGQDLGDRTNAASVDLERTLRDEYEPMLRAIIDCPVPTITALNGAAAGAGANLALSSDVVIAAHSAYLMQAFTRIGLMPDAAGTYIMPRAMGMAKAMGASLFAEKIYAQQAEQWGLIWEAVPNEAFEQTWKERAVQLATGPTVAYQNIKKALRQSLKNSMDEQLGLEARLQKECGQTRDFVEGVLAFSQKRSANFEGR
ncbi:MAG: 2-(1,2-epoxy-1,2-dihydrophenyl)acetyl-CoA isomerase [Rhodobacteraceae bacterium]|nr:2-(1,2-epoxy-1,2-dihydrophenyl)acetyl-CoA isomerase [Paracoccaceae bacterium]